MSLDYCCTCNHKFTNRDGDYAHADGGFMEANHGVGQCRPCYLKSGHKECGKCGQLAYERMKFCHECGTRYPVE